MGQCFSNIFLTQAWYAAQIQMLGTWLADRMNHSLHPYQCTCLAHIVKVLFLVFCPGLKTFDSRSRYLWFLPCMVKKKQLFLPYLVVPRPPSVEIACWFRSPRDVANIAPRSWRCGSSSAYRYRATTADSCWKNRVVCYRDVVASCTWHGSV